MALPALLPAVEASAPIELSATLNQQMKNHRPFQLNIMCCVSGDAQVNWSSYDNRRIVVRNNQTLDKEEEKDCLLLRFFKQLIMCCPCSERVENEVKENKTVSKSVSSYLLKSYGEPVAQTSLLYTGVNLKEKHENGKALKTNELRKILAAAESFKNDECEYLIKQLKFYRAQKQLTRTYSKLAPPSPKDKRLKVQHSSGDTLERLSKTKMKKSILSLPLTKQLKEDTLNKMLKNIVNSLKQKYEDSVTTDQIRSEIAQELKDWGFKIRCPKSKTCLKN